MVDTLAFVIVFAAMVCAVVGFVYARRVFVAQRNKDFERSQIYGISTKKRSAAGRMQTKSGTWLEAKLLFAGIGLAPSVFVFSVLITGLLVGTLLQSIMPGFGFVVGVVAAAVGAWVFLGVAANKRSADFDKQLAAALPMVAENLRGGSGLETSISAVAQFMPDPLHSELNRVIDDVATTSLSLPEALERLGTRVDSKEVRFLATSFLIQREGGGNLANMVDTVAETIARRIDLRDQVKASTSNARFSAIFVSAMPFGVFAIFVFATPEYMAAFWAFPLWPVILALATALDAIGLFVIRRLYTMKLD